MKIKMREAGIYSVVCPLSNEVVYVGKSNSITKRLYCHIHSAKSSKSPLHPWIKKLRSDGLNPIFKVLELLETNEGISDIILRRENYWITHFINKHCVLFNITRKIVKYPDFRTTNEKIKEYNPKHYRGPYKPRKARNSYH